MRPGKTLLQPPHFAVRPAPEFGRIKKNAVVAPFAPHLARGEFGGIVDHPADRAVGHVRQERVGLARLDRLLRSIDMRHRRALGRQGERADAGIAEQVQHLIAFTHPFAHPRPLRCHVGKESQVAERRVLREQQHFLPPYMPPATRHVAREVPLASAVLVRRADEIAVRRPAVRCRSPHRLGFGPYEAEAAVAFELAAMARIDEPVIRPRLGDEGGEVHRPESRAVARSAMYAVTAAKVPGSDA